MVKDRFPFRPSKRTSCHRTAHHKEKDLLRKILLYTRVDAVPGLCQDVRQHNAVRPNPFGGFMRNRLSKTVVVCELALIAVAGVAMAQAPPPAPGGQAAPGAA